VKIVRNALDDMIAHARETAPDECCGLLVGARGVIERIHRARNLQASPTRYSIDPVDHFAAIHAARSQGQRVVGAYHSHPTTGPVLSETDIAEASGGSGFVYVIVSLLGPEVRAYQMKRGTLEEALISAE
jgi:proteasome lid subunit RPN8/RPN11